MAYRPQYTEIQKAEALAYRMERASKQLMQAAANLAEISRSDVLNHREDQCADLEQDAKAIVAKMLWPELYAEQLAKQTGGAK